MKNEMKRKGYVAPTMKITRLKHRVGLMQGSAVIQDEVGMNAPFQENVT